MKPSCHLQVLGLSCTELTDVAAIALSRALVRGKLSDSSTDRSVKSSASLSTELSVRSSAGQCFLRRLDLSRNRITDEGAR